MDMPPICIDIDEQNIGLSAADFIPGNMRWFVDDGSNKMHFGGSDQSTYGHLLGSILLSAVRN
jgi:hypothetical protein